MSHISTKCVLPLIFCRRALYQYKQLTFQQRNLVPETSYIRVHASVWAEAALQSEDVPKPKPIEHTTRPQGTTGSRYDNPHYARHVRVPDEQVLIDEPYHPH